MPGMADPAPPKRRWFHLTPDRLVLVLLAVEGSLLFAERFGWCGRGWPVLISVVGLCTTAP